MSGGAQSQPGMKIEDSSLNSRPLGVAFSGMDRGWYRLQASIIIIVIFEYISIGRT